MTGEDEKEKRELAACSGNFMSEPRAWRDRALKVLPLHAIVQMVFEHHHAVDGGCCPLAVSSVLPRYRSTATTTNDPYRESQ